MAHLGKLSLHYWRPDFTERHAKLLFDDFYDALKGFASETVAGACKIYREREDSKFFPAIGPFLAICRRVPDPGYAPGKAMRL